MSNFQKKGWCRFCQANLIHNFIDNRTYFKVICSNCGRSTPEKAFLRYDKRRKNYIKKLKEKNGI